MFIGEPGSDSSSYFSKELILSLVWERMEKLNKLPQCNKVTIKCVLGNSDTESNKKAVEFAKKRK